MEKHTQESIRAAVREALQKPETLYSRRFINHRGSVDGVRYTELMADELLKQIDAFKRIAAVQRHRSYDAGHTGATTASGSARSNRSEKVLAITLFNQGTDHIGTIGTIFDYEVPLAEKRTSGVGKIDLLSHTEQCVYLLELKREDSVETLLRCVLEVYTYYKQLRHERFFEDYRNSGKLQNPLALQMAVLVFQGQAAHEEYKDKQGSAATLALMEHLGVELFVLRKNNENYEVTTP